MPLRREPLHLMEAAFFNHCRLHFKFILSQEDASVVTDEELDLAVFTVARVHSKLNVRVQSKAVMKNITSISLSRSYLP